LDQALLIALKAEIAHPSTSYSVARSHRSQDGISLVLRRWFFATKAKFSCDAIPRLLVQVTRRSGFGCASVIGTPM
jgi:hypothetical protein